MKSRIFFSGMFVIFLIELTVLILFALTKTKNLQDTVAVNEVVQTVQGNWDSLEDHINHTTLDYTVLSSDGSVLYKTRSGLSESLNMAISHKDTILDIKIGELIVGKLIIYNNDALILQS